MRIWQKVTISLIGAAVIVACSQSPTGRSALRLFSGSEMDQLGARTYEEIKKEEKISTDSRKIAYVQCVTDDLVASLPAPYSGKRWEVTLFANDQVNAFALPGEKIGVYEGLLDVAKTRDQLAAVIGHEIGHVIAEHGNERMSSQTAAGIGMQLGGILAASELDQETAGLAMAVLGAGVQIGILLPYSRSHESEADQLGVDYMAKAGYDPSAAAKLWRNMAASKGAQPPEFLSTHPSPQSRIQALQRYESQAMPVYRQAIASKGQPDCQRPSS